MVATTTDTITTVVTIVAVVLDSTATTATIAGKMSYLDQIRREANEGLRDLCRGALGAGEISEPMIEAAVESQLEIRGKDDFKRFATDAESLVAALRNSSDHNLAHVAAKILKSLRLAAYTEIIGEDAVYVDQPITLD